MHRVVCCVLYVMVFRVHVDATDGHTVLRFASDVFTDTILYVVSRKLTLLGLLPSCLVFWMLRNTPPVPAV
jgi:hypothetical protein